MERTYLGVRYPYRVEGGTVTVELPFAPDSEQLAAFLEDAGYPVEVVGNELRWGKDYRLYDSGRRWFFELKSRRPGGYTGVDHHTGADLDRWLQTIHTFSL